MQHASCVLILAGKYATFSKWIKIEIELAKELNKTIFAVKPFANTQISSVVQETADKIVNWNTNSIVSAIRG